ncbi:site-specific integrase [Pilimelia terevasa]|uniref:Site-specific integrase n=1 Tax=Pilimelia terevasa TaxID=53372 RepID=A0A8J3BD88_9ACTN|nr:integrase [Pilimelia terevasa]GGK13033.1 site-specific integrase [Pilimelia terevasa]
MNTTYDVRIFAIDERPRRDRKTGKPVSSWRVRWQVGDRVFPREFATKALAEGFRSRLLTFQHQGVPFDLDNGLPEPMARQARACSWYQHMIAFIDHKWPGASAKHRRGIAEALAAVTPALLSTAKGAPSVAEIRAAVYSYVANTTRRGAGPPPAKFAATVAWLEAHTLDITALADGEILHRVLDAIGLKKDGTPAAASTVVRKRTIFSHCLRYAVELNRLQTHPLRSVSRPRPKTRRRVERSVLVNKKQAGKLLAAVAEKNPELEAFFACLYHAGLRPEEALRLEDSHYRRPTEPDGWGELLLPGATLLVGAGWSNDGKAVEDRGLKHRDEDATRPVPASPTLCRYLDKHLEVFGVGPGRRLFVVRRGAGGRLLPAGKARPVSQSAYGTAWDKARKRALTPAEYASPLARRPYDLRHACLTRWINLGTPLADVADWAGNSPGVLLAVYAGCIDGERATLLKRIAEADEGD